MFGILGDGFLLVVRSQLLAVDEVVLVTSRFFLHHQIAEVIDNVGAARDMRPVVPIQRSQHASRDVEHGNRILASKPASIFEDLSGYDSRAIGQTVDLHLAIKRVIVDRHTKNLSNSINCY